MIECSFDNGHRAKLRHVVVDTIAVKGGKMLMVKRSTNLHYEPGKWTLPGGYMDRGEVAVAAAQREMMEESGWEIDDVTLFRINDNPKREGEDNQNIALIFIGKPVKQISDSDHEIDEVRWFNLDKLPPTDQIAFDHADSIKLYKKWLREKFTIPVLG